MATREEEPRDIAKLSSATPNGTGTGMASWDAELTSPEFSEIDLTPPESRLATLSERADALAEQPRRIAEELELRQECLALAQLACRDDDIQLSTASAALAAAYQRAGSHAAAARHAAHAEGLLTYEGGPTTTTAPAHINFLLASSRRTLACAHAANKEYVRALEYFPRAVAASERAHGPDHPQLCPLLRSFARMVVQRSGDYATAEALLLRELELRTKAVATAAYATTAKSVGGGAGGAGGVGGGGGGGGGGDAEGIVQLEQERAVMMLRHAKLLDSRAAELKLTTGGGASAASGGGVSGAACAACAAGGAAHATACGGGASALSSRARADGRVAYHVAPGFVQRTALRPADGAAGAAHHARGGDTYHEPFLPKRVPPHLPTSSMAPPVARPLGERASQLQRPSSGASHQQPAHKQRASSSADHPVGGGGPLARFLKGGSSIAAADVNGMSGMSAAELAGLATRKRHEAAAILNRELGGGGGGESGGGSGGGGSGGGSGGEGGGSGEGGSGEDGGGEESAGSLPEAESAAEARLAVQLACAYKDLGQWKAAESAYLRAIPFHENEKGHSDPRALQLWGEVRVCAPTRAMPSCRLLDLPLA